MLEDHELYKIDIRLIAVHTLYEERILRPVHPREILVRRRSPIISPPVDFNCLARRHVPNEQVHHGIWPTGARVALLDDAHLVRLDVEPGDDIDRGLIHARIGDIAVVRAPPVAGETMHLFLCHEFGDAIRNRFVRLGGGGEAGSKASLSVSWRTSGAPSPSVTRNRSPPIGTSSVSAVPQL